MEILLQGLGALFFVVRLLLFLVLIVLALVLVLLLAALISPIHYQALAEQGEKWTGSALVRWLFVRAEVTYDGDEPVVQVKLFGKSFSEAKQKRAKKRKPKRHSQTEKKQAKTPASPVVQPEETTLVSAEKPVEIKKTEQKPSAAAETDIQEKEIRLQPPAEEIIREKPEETAQESSRPSKIRRVALEEIQEKEPEQESEISPAFFTGENEEQKENILWQAIRKENLKELLQAVFRLLRRIFRTVRPNDLRLRCTVGTGDPAMTGWVLAAAGMAKAKFGEHLQVKGDFSQATLADVFFQVKGKICMMTLAWAGIAFVLTKPVRHIWITLWKAWKRKE